jgi:hypothetical protein
MKKKLGFFTVILSFFFFGITSVLGQTPLILGAFNKKVVPNETVCIGIYGRDFEQILSMQYSLKWDAKALKFSKIQNYGLPSINGSNFGLNRTKEGILSFAWYDAGLKGITLPDGQVLYEICFQVIGQKGSTTTIQFTNTPTVIEVSMGKGVLIGLNTEGGKIEIR